MKVSVVVPVYNTERYLQRCLDSILSQTFHDFEVLCIDDGSSDRSWEIIESYSGKDDRFRPIRLEENHGVPFARNLALDIAKGEFVYFMDSDDWIDPGLIEEMYKAAIRTGNDVVINRNWYKEYDDPSARKPSGDFGFIKPDPGFYSPLLVQSRFFPVVWTRLYRLKYLNDNNIRSPLLKGGVEDNFFTSLAEILQDKSYIFSGPFYHYYQREGSLVTQPGAGFRHFENFRLFYDELRARNIPKGRARLFFVPRKLVMENEFQFDFIRSFFSDVVDEVREYYKPYSMVDIFLLTAMLSCPDYSEWLSKYNPSAYLSYFSFIKKNGDYPSTEAMLRGELNL
ncbi:MAG: glycosyltransferase family 2 protein [Bacteroidales bacterium]|nr:glycosyltransferase family 2 protein [Bacteroidales bacterium]